MYHKKHDNQLSVYDFVLPFGGHLNENNRWVVLRKMINWSFIEEEYMQNFEGSEKGPDGFSSDVAFGSLYIQRSLGFSDRELVEQITENPYLQYFIGFKEYSNEKPFDPSLLVTFRKRFPEETMNRIIENMFSLELHKICCTIRSILYNPNLIAFCTSCVAPYIICTRAKNTDSLMHSVCVIVIIHQLK